MDQSSSDNSKLLDEYQKILSKDPDSKVFAALAELYRGLSLFEQAESIAMHGVKRHPSYANGHLVLSRIYSDQGKTEEALIHLKKVIEISPENLLAYELMGQIFLKLKKPKEALKAHKMALFLNPLSERSRRAVQKLESLSADEFDKDLFELKTLKPSESGAIKYRDLERVLSLIDAYIVRNQLDKAHEVFKQIPSEYENHPEVKNRAQLFHGIAFQGFKNEESPNDKSDFSKTRSLDSKIKILEKLLKKIQDFQGPLKPDYT